jgi:Fe-S cluster assembly ATP-binding protein
MKIVAEGVNRLLGPNMGALVITHYQRLLNYIKPNRISILFEGRVVMTGGPELALELERSGYDLIREQYSEQAPA